MKSLGRYQILMPLAEGADEAFLARTVDANGADYHLVRWIGDGAFEAARRAVWLRHPNLVSMRELDATDGRWYVASEYVHGEDLRRVLTRVRRADDQVPIALVAAIGAAAAAGLHHAHTHQGAKRSRRGSVHGAVSPSCIMIGYDGSVKVAELGMGTAADPSYLAPEQVAGGGIDRRTDVYALGVVLYELVTARRLFKAPSEALTKAAITHAVVPPPSRFRRGLPKAFEAIILKAIARSPSDRFRSAGELRAALEAFAQRVGMRQSRAGMADYLKTLFGARPFPWQPAVGRSAERITLELFGEDRQPGVAAPPDWVLRDLGVPEASELEATPGRGVKTPMSWTTQAPASQLTPRRMGVLAGVSLAAAVAGFLAVGAIGRSGDDAAVTPMSAPPPPPASVEPAPPLPPPPPPVPAAPAVTPDASPGDGSAAAPAPAPATGASAKPARLQPRPKRAPSRAAARHRASNKPRIR